jgi:flagellar export protein FliJ
MFTFTLQTALNVRGRQEKMCMKALAEKLAIERQILQRIEGIHSDTLKAETELNDALQSRHVSIDQMRFLSDFKNRMREALIVCHRELMAAQEAVARKQQALIEASRAKRTLEILREKEEKRYLEKFAMLERKHLDEIAGNQFVHQHRAVIEEQALE